MQILLNANFLSDQNKPRSEDIGMILKFLSYEEANL